MAVFLNLGTPISRLASPPSPIGRLAFAAWQAQVCVAKHLLRLRATEQHVAYSNIRGTIFDASWGFDFSGPFGCCRWAFLGFSFTALLVCACLEICGADRQAGMAQRDSWRADRGARGDRPYGTCSRGEERARGHFS